MNELTLAQGKELLNKIRHDLTQGYKVLGNYVNQVDRAEYGAVKKI